MTYQHLDFRGYRSPLTLPSMWDTTILGIPVTGNVRWSPSIFEWRTVTTTMFTLEPNYTSIQQNYTQQVFVHMYPISISSSIFDACHGHPSIVEHLKWQTGNSVDQSFWKGSLCWWLKSGVYHLRLVVEIPIIYRGLGYIPGACLGFLNHQQFQWAGWCKALVFLFQPILVYPYVKKPRRNGTSNLKHPKQSLVNLNGW